MSKRRRASELIYKHKHTLKYPVKVVAVESGTGTVAQKGVYTVVATTGASHAATSCYVTYLVATNRGTLIGSA